MLLPQFLIQISNLQIILNNKGNFKIDFNSTLFYDSNVFIFQNGKNWSDILKAKTDDSILYLIDLEKTKLKILELEETLKLISVHTPNYNNVRLITDSDKKKLAETLICQAIIETIKPIGYSGLPSVKIKNTGLNSIETNDFDILIAGDNEIFAIEVKNRGTIEGIGNQIKRGQSLFLPIYFYFYNGDKLKGDLEAYIKTPDHTENREYGDYKKWQLNNSNQVNLSSIPIYNIDRLYFLDYSKDLKNQFTLVKRINSKFDLGLNDEDFAKQYNFTLETILP